jgi:hypothetical protein
VSYAINRQTFEMRAGIDTTFGNDADWTTWSLGILAGQSRIVSWPAQKVFIQSPLVLAAFDLCLKCSHLFNILDARGAISVTERVGVITRIRALAVGVAKAYVDQQQGQQEPAAEATNATEPVGAEK